MPIFFHDFWNSAVKFNDIHRSLLVLATSLFVLPVQAQSMNSGYPQGTNDAPAGNPTVPQARYQQNSGNAQREPGWQGLANVLKKLEPSVDTSIPETASAAATRLSNMISQGQAGRALPEIERRQNEGDRITNPATDVQMLFLKGRALAALERKQEAMEVYRGMTVHYPELAEPWNNMAALYLQAGLLDPAYEALKTAITINPRYGIALRNMGMVQLMLSQKSFAAAASNGLPEAAGQARATQRIIQGN